jgi:hypothetical protein
MLTRVFHFRCLLQIARLQQLVAEPREQAQHNRQDARQRQRQADDGDGMVALVKQMSSEDDQTNDLPATATSEEAGT